MSQGNDGRFQGLPVNFCQFDDRKFKEFEAQDCRPKDRGKLLDISQIDELGRMRAGIQDLLMKIRSEHGSLFKNDGFNRGGERISCVPIRLETHSLLEFSCCRILHIIIDRLIFQQGMDGHAVGAKIRGEISSNIGCCSPSEGADYDPWRAILKILMGTPKDSSLARFNEGLSCTFLASCLTCACCTDENTGFSGRCKSDEFLLLGIVGNDVAMLICSLLGITDTIRGD